ncbi:hypothetical protein, partial [Escherichia coli]|uniref:hypothetical protein n=1 Tax=Escherichia coli TaxID=562 RepID=UPI003B5283CF
VPAYGPQNDVTLKMPAFEWVHVQLHQQKGMISLSPPTICNSASGLGRYTKLLSASADNLKIFDEIWQEGMKPEDWKDEMLRRAV